MQKNAKILIGIVVVLVVIGGGYVIFHKSSKPTTTGGTTANAVNNAVLTTKTDSSLGNYLAEPNGTPLYIYNGDSSGTSKVTGSLLASWPAYQDTSATSGLPTGVGTIKRADNGQTQFTYNGMPLYTFVADSSGKVTGNNVSNFSIARPAAVTPSSSSSSSSNNPY